MGTTSIPQEGYNTAWLKSTDMPVFSHHIPFHGGIVPEKRHSRRLGIAEKSVDDKPIFRELSATDH